MVYTVTVNPSLDYIICMEELHTGAMNRAFRERIVPGGKGINVSMVLHEFGVKNTALGFTAGFVGEEIEKSLAQMGIRTDFIRVPDGCSRINVKLCAKEETEINGSGPSLGPAQLCLLSERLEKLEKGDCLVLSGSVPTGLPEDLYGSMVREARGRGACAVVDAERELLLRCLPQRPFLVKPNRAELETLAGTALTTEEELIRAAAKLQEMGAENVLVSLGGEGALLLTAEREVLTIPAYAGNAVYSVGAGDSMVAGFLAAWLHTRSYEEALKTAVAAGSAAAFSDSLAARRETEGLLASGSPGLRRRPLP